MIESLLDLLPKSVRQMHVSRGPKTATVYSNSSPTYIFLQKGAVKFLV